MSWLKAVWQFFVNLYQTSKPAIKSAISKELDSCVVDLADIIKNAESKDPNVIADDICSFLLAMLATVIKAPLILKLASGLLVMMKPIIVSHLQGFDKLDPLDVAKSVIEAVKSYILARL